MPTPSKAFRELYRRFEGQTRLSVTTLNKRFQACLKLEAGLTAESFFAMPGNLTRERQALSLRIVEQGDIRLIDVCRALACDGLSVSGARRRLMAFLMKFPGVNEFASIEALGRALDSEVSDGPANPITVEGVLFHNLAVLAKARHAAISVSRRTLADRVAAAKSGRGLGRADALKLTEREFRALVAPKAVQLAFDEFARALEAYRTLHGLQIVDGEGAAAVPLTVEAAYARYENNRTPFLFRCLACAAECPDASTFRKSLSHWSRQGCPVCARKSGDEERRLTACEVMARIAAHPAGIDWVGESESYINRKSPLTVRCRYGGHEFTRTADTFFTEGAIKQCPDCRQGRLGETIAVSVANFLLDTGRPASAAREITPPHLRALKSTGAPFRHDGYFEVASPPMRLAIEHMGAQHFNPKHPFHEMSPLGAAKSYKRMRARDARKRKACLAAGCIFVDLPDLAEHCRTDVEAALFVAERLLAKTGGAVRSIHGYESRMRKLSDESFVKELIRAGSLLSPERRLQEQLDIEGAPIEILDFDAVGRRFKLRCRAHPRQAPWFALATNAIGSETFNRRGTRCPACKSEKMSRDRRLTETKLDARAKGLGFVKDFPYSDYKNNSQVLCWRCLRDKTHIIKDTLSHLGRGCRHCRGGARGRIARASTC